MSVARGHPAVTVHGTCVCLGGTGVLLTGAPGSGKSSLALSLIDAPGRGLSERLLTAKLVADDQVSLVRKGPHLEAGAPAALAGRLEIRGIGLVAVPSLSSCTVGLVVRLRAAGEVERMPRAGQMMTEICGVEVAQLSVAGHATTAPAIVRAAVTLVENGRFRATDER